LTKIYLGLGSNVGERYQHLQNCCRLLSDFTDISIIKQSSIVESPPLYNENQPSFLNQVIQIETDIKLDKLHKITRDIEKGLGKDVYNGHNKPRTLDIDILTYGNKKIKTNMLTIPHPRIAERRFVLEPLSEIAENFVLPGQVLTVASLLEITEDISVVSRWQPEKEVCQ